MSYFEIYITELYKVLCFENEIFSEILSFNALVHIILKLLHSSFNYISHVDTLSTLTYKM